MVPADWQHPKNEQGNYIPLLDGFNKSLADWVEGNAKWAEGLRKDFANEGKWIPIEAKYAGQTFEDWYGPRPDPKDYMPDWPADQRTHVCMYEDCSEGTPISPVCATPEECARWLADNGASAFGHQTATYQQWLATCKRGWAIGLVYDSEKGMRNGVQLNAEKP